MTTTERLAMEELETRIQSMKTDIRHSAVKTVCELVVSTWFIGSFRFNFDINREYLGGTDYATVVLAAIATTVNVTMWFYWVMYRYRALFPSRYGGFESSAFGTDSSWDDYREHEYRWSRTKRREAAFDVLFGIQFLSIAMAYLLNHVFFL